MAAGHAGQDAARPAGAAASSASAATRPSRPTCASSPPPTSDLEAAGRPRARSARTSTTGSTASPSTCRRCASGATTCRCWLDHFLFRFNRELGRRGRPSVAPEAHAPAAGVPLAGQRARAAERAEAGAAAGDRAQLLAAFIPPFLRRERRGRRRRRAASQPRRRSTSMAFIRERLCPTRPMSMPRPTAKSIVALHVGAGAHGRKPPGRREVPRHLASDHARPACARWGCSSPTP